MFNGKIHYFHGNFQELFWHNQRVPFCGRLDPSPDRHPRGFRDWVPLLWRHLRARLQILPKAVASDQRHLRGCKKTPSGKRWSQPQNHRLVVWFSLLKLTDSSTILLINSTFLLVYFRFRANCSPGDFRWRLTTNSQHMHPQNDQVESLDESSSSYILGVTLVSSLVYIHIRTIIT